MHDDPRPERWWVRRDRKRAERAGIDPVAFFAETYPRAILRDVTGYQRLSGTACITVRGFGHWTLRLGDLDEPVRREADKNADASICFVPTTFGRFLSGELDVRRAMRAGEVVVRGDPRLIASIGNILNPARNLLQARASNW